ncbi:MAG: adenosylcobinamide-GDP ribazoletransferase [Gammaproteobacteria bacterium]|nr:adenosylcobinamide-GDP ribazoletransferase [Gammaproteobacteria bacterium]
MTEQVSDEPRPSALGAAVAALEFYTRIPRPPGIAFHPSDARHAAAFAPLAGWIVAAVSALVYAIAAGALPAVPAVVLALAAGVLLTGALHEDGFADTCDAFGARADRERTLAILKDPRCGAYAVTGLALLVVAKVAALAFVAEARGAFAVVVTLLAAHSFSRFAAVSAMHGRAYARSGDSSARAGDFATSPGGRDLAIAALLGSAPLLLFPIADLGWAMLCVLPAALALIWLTSIFDRRIGGYTGDCLGAVQQSVEVIVLMSACAAAGAGS